MSTNDTEYHVDANEVLAELQAEGHEIEGKVPSQPEEPKQEPTEEPAQEPTQEPEEPLVIERKPKEPALIPAWKAKIAEERLQKENEALRKQIEDFQRNPTKENKATTEATIDNIRELAEESGLELDERQEKFFRTLMGTVQKNAVPTDALKTLEALQQQREIELLESQFDQEFSKDVLPLIKERYGDLPERELATLRTKLHDLAFSEQYAKVALKKVFRAENDDLGFTPTKPSVHTSKSGKTRGTDIDYSQMDESTFANLSDEQVDAYLATQRAGTWRNTGR